MSETARVRAWIYTTLTTDPTLQGLIATRAFYAVAPAGSQFPYVIFQMISPGNDLIALGAARIWANPLFRVKAVTKGGSTGAIEPIDNRIDALLHAKSGQVTNGVIWECVRERPYEQPEITDGTLYQNLGGDYRIKASNA